MEKKCEGDETAETYRREQFEDAKAKYCALHAEALRAHDFEEDYDSVHHDSEPSDQNSSPTPDSAVTSLSTLLL
jgi:hypothetical protein